MTIKLFMQTKKLLLISFFSVISIIAMAQKGTIKGIVKDAKINEPLIGATVVLKGTTIGAATDIDGKYVIHNVNPGNYELNCSFISYKTKSMNNVVVNLNTPLEINFALNESDIALGNISIMGWANRQSENVLLLEQKEAIIATQAIGAQKISREGISDAKGAVTKISGVSKQEGVKNVFVRGLGDRFNATLLNGFPLPSEDPEYKNISLSFFASDMIESVSVSKVFSPENSGDVGGAEINISSRQLTKQTEKKISLSAGANTKTVNVKFLETDGVNNFGYTKNNLKPSDMTKYSFQHSLDPSSGDLQINRDVSFSWGKKYLTGRNKNSLRFFMLGKYSTDFDYTNGVIKNTTTTGTIYKDQDFDKYTRNTSHIVMLTTNYNPGNGSLFYNGLYIHTNIQSVGNYFGKDSEFEDSDDTKGLQRRQQVNDNTIIVNQLKYEQPLSEKLKLETGISYNKVNGNEPDRRINYLTYLGNDILRPLKGTGRQQRYFSEITENDINLKAILEYKLKEDNSNNSLLKFGYNGRIDHRNFNAVEYDHSLIAQSELNRYNFSLDNVFNQEELDNGNFSMDKQNDNYGVDKYIHSGFVELIFNPWEKITAVTGIRLDKVNMRVDYNIYNGGTVGETKIDELYFMPSLNLKYDTNKKNTVRLGLSRTYTLPQDKEISPFQYVFIDFKSQGNPDLKPAINYNIDLKWDNYLSSGELLSAGGFFKVVKDPISRIEKASAGGYLSYDNISDKATIAGAEVEFRKTILKTTYSNNAKNTLTMDLNASYTYTNVEHDNTTFTHSSSKLEGAAPLIINANLSDTYKKKNFSLTNSFILNYFSDRIYTIGTQGFENIMEKGIPTLNFVSSSKFKKRWEVSFKVKNLLNPNFELERDSSNDANSVTLSNYKKGMSFSLGISYNL